MQDLGGEGVDTQGRDGMEMTHTQRRGGRSERLKNINSTITII